MPRAADRSDDEAVDQDHEHRIEHEQRDDAEHNQIDHVLRVDDTRRLRQGRRGARHHAAPLGLAQSRAAFGSIASAILSPGAAWASEGR